MMTLKEYAKAKRKIQAEINDVKYKMERLFNGSMYNDALYQTFSSEKKRMYSSLRDMELTLRGQLDTFKIFEGDENTEYNRIRERYFELERQEKGRTIL